MSVTALPSKTRDSNGTPHSDLELQDMQHFLELGRLSATLLHEISNPLTAAILNLEELRPDNPGAIRKVRRSLNIMKNYVNAARRQVSASSALSSFCIHPQIEELKRIVMPMARASDIQLKFENIPHYRLQGDPIIFQQVLANLIINSIDSYRHTIGDGLKNPVILKVSGYEDHIEIEVADWGCGIPAEMLPNLFKPFYSTKSVYGYGLGIGLTIVKKHVQEDFNGTIKVISSHRIGTHFILRLPATSYTHSHYRKKPLL